ncbi:programmed cell death 1 ligand 1 [Neoarius graeffei]|uniref:programmed cell death 1 ligand 1 n=1 Tax=Neoarius graeffei TaxID=443677 RepID=UPI00298D1403|nr:programmed cell death 1 ligand 1 [Neoarius graeffei]
MIKTRRTVPMRGEIFTLLFVTWPCLQALFIVESEQDSYNGELHDKITMGCRFSHVPNVSQISVIWKRIKPLPGVDIYKLDNGIENYNFTNKQFQPRVRLLREELKNFRAVLELSQLHLNDSGTYQCIVIQDELDYKQTELTVQAPYKAIKKTVKRLSEKEVELSCESQGLPLAHVTWSNDKLMGPQLTHRSESSQAKNSDGVFVVTSRLSVTHDVNNYTCSYMTDDGKTNLTATFRIPAEIPEDPKGATGYAAIAVLILMFMGFIFALLFLCRRKKGQTSTGSPDCEAPGQNLTSTDHLLPKPDFRVSFTSA